MANNPLLTTYTDVDLANAAEYAQQRLRLVYLHHLMEKAPHIASHFTYSITQADVEKDYYYPPVFRRKAIKVNIRINPTVCEKISCNTVRTKDACDPTDVAEYLRVGDQELFERVCQPACYNLYNRTVYDDDGKELPQMLRVAPREDKCVIVGGTAIWLEQPYYRSTDHYEKRLNDLPIGFNRGPENPITQSGLQYEYNKTYCDAYFDKWDPVNKDCYVPWYEVILRAVVGESIVKLINSGVVLIENGLKSDIPQPDLPKPPPIESIWLLDNWRDDIDPNFILPPIDIELPDAKDGSQRCDDIIYDKNDYKFVDSRKGLAIKPTGEYTKRLIKKTIESTLAKTMMPAYERQNLDAFILKENHTRRVAGQQHMRKFAVTEKQQKVDEQPNIGDILLEILGSILYNTDPAYWRDIAIGAIFDVILTQFATITKQLITKIIPKIADLLINATYALLSNVFGGALKCFITMTISRVAIQMASKVIIALCRMLAQAASIIGIVLLIVGFFDIALMIWDPLGYNKKFDKIILKRVMEENEFALREDFNVNRPEMTFDLLCMLMIEPNVGAELGLQIFGFIYEYLDALEVNSEGTRINKGVIVRKYFDKDQQDKTIVESKLWSPDDLYFYEQYHAMRMRYFTSVKPYVLTLTGIGCLLLVLKIYYLALILFILAILVAYTTYLNATVNVGRFVENSAINLNKNTETK